MPVVHVMCFIDVFVYMLPLMTWHNTFHDDDIYKTISLCNLQYN